ncbi:SipW-dependent-type signal peptide-containing protein [Brevibacterium sp. JSBI002]|uniref:SipW-dependent-type signal peptide-containing protein n=1 Tax=Brevibacterium sp. JSBI002 TaxID=2886045 RepID=UPI002230D6C1|nr:SipW-dependent-type signal peptide-containing protein [Brevibacterium sp. JSBI002]UZD62180.1 SipW-dependent-type signal peptide-containing protein [Brevibacterium sp. JSBI002]
MSLRRAVFAAAAAAAAGALLIGGGATYAAWSDSAESETAKISAGSLEADISQSGPSDVSYGTNPSIYPSSGSKGIIPGVQAQRWTYTITNSTKSATAAVGTVDIVGSPSNDDDYAAMRSYLRASATIDGTKKVIPSSAFGSSGFSHKIDLGKTLKPGGTATFTLDLSMPATSTNSAGKKVDVAVELLNRRSASLDVQSIFTMRNSLQLKQAGKP